MAREVTPPPAPAKAVTPKGHCGGFTSPLARSLASAAAPV